MPIIRVPKLTNYTVMSNHHLTDRDLSFKAKGLMSYMLSRPDDWDFTIAGLSRLNKDGRDAIGRIIQELESHGYLERIRLRRSKGTFGTMEYVLHEQPMPGNPALDNPALENPVQENPVLDNPAQENPTLGYPVQENRPQLNTDRQNTERKNKERKNNESSTTDLSNPDPSSTEHMRVSEVQEEVKERIGYDSMIVQYDKDRVDEIVGLIVDVLTSRKDFYLINGAETPECRVKEHLRRFNDSHLEYVFDCLQNNCSDIRNIRSYLLTTIYNAVDTISNYYDSRVRHDWA